MEDAIAERGQYGERQEDPIGGRESHQQDSGRHGNDAEQHQPVAAVAIDQNADEGLTDAGDPIEQRDDQAERGVADPEFKLQQRKQRSQDDLIEVREQMRERHQSDDQSIGTSRDLGRGHRRIRG